MKNSNIDELLTNSFKSLSSRNPGGSIADDVMQQVIARDAEENVGSRRATAGMGTRNIILVLGLGVGLIAGAPAFLDLTRFLPEIAERLTVLPELGAVREGFSVWLSAHPIDPNLFAAAFAGVAMSALVLYPAFEE